MRKAPNQIRLLEDGVELYDPNDRSIIWTCLWNDVKEIAAWKEDLYIHDLICLGFRIEDDPHYLFCHEENQGWDDLLKAIENRFKINTQDWGSRVTLPAFKENWTSIWGEKFPRPCKTCSYDVRATPTRCPECGTIVKPDE